ncbi:MAG: AcrB/AcrD/AcrF family protein, partial [Gammaproteobacteria bacterium]
MSSPDRRRGGLAAWSMRRPVATVVLTFAVVVLGLFSLGSLPVNLLPDIVYPRINVRVSDPGVSVGVMEERVTRQLEEQLAITEDATSVESTTTEGSSSVRLYFEYGKDIDVALRDASTRLDRARRFLPDTIDQPIIYKRDPSQRPVMEYVVSSADKSPMVLRDWADHVFARWFYNIPGVAAVEVGGGLQREVRVLPDQQKLAGMGMTVADIVRVLKDNNISEPAGRMRLSGLEYGSRTEGRLTTLAQLAALPVPVGDNDSVRLDEVARIEDGHEEETLRVRFNDIAGVKVSIQKQPQANTVDVVNRIRARLDWLKTNQLIDADVQVNKVADQSVYVRDSLRNAAWAVVAGSVLAMLVVWLFLGSWRYTLIIGTAIPVSIFVSFILMQLAGLSLNVMTLGGLALGVGMLVDSTIVMLENIARHRQLDDSSPQRAGQLAAAEVNSPIVASTTTNLVAVLPFLFIGGLVGLLFRELILTITAAIAASMIIALTLVPSLAVRARLSSSRGLAERAMALMAKSYAALLRELLAWRWLIIFLALAGSILAGWMLSQEKSGFLPDMDNGQVYIHLKADAGISLQGMDGKVRVVEEIIQQQPAVQGVFTTSGGWIFGRTQRQIANMASIRVQLTPRSQRDISSAQWARHFSKAVAARDVPGLKVFARASRIRGISAGKSDEGVSLKIQGPDLDQLVMLADRVKNRLKTQPSLRNLQHNMEDVRQEYVIDIDRARAADLGLDLTNISRQIRVAMSGIDAGGLSSGDRIWPIRVMLPQNELNSPEALKSLLIFGETEQRPAIRLGDVAVIRLEPAPVEILRENQRRTAELSASISPGYTLSQATAAIRDALSGMDLPAGYHFYLGDAAKELEQGRSNSLMLLGLALFLVFVVLAVQYESLLNPLVILLSAPVSLIGVLIGLKLTGTPVTMPVWLGMIMLAGIVVNNAIVLVETIQQLYDKGADLTNA